MFSFARRVEREGEGPGMGHVSLRLSANVAHVAMSSSSPIRALEEIGRCCWRRDVSCEWCILDMVVAKKAIILSRVEWGEIPGEGGREDDLAR